MDGPRDAFRYDAADVVALQEQFTVRPVPPDAIRERAEAGDALATTDVPAHLAVGVAPGVDAATALYRLVQLFGTPNVPGLEAGADQPSRDATTWQYLFEVTYVPGDDGDTNQDGEGDANQDGEGDANQDGEGDANQDGEGDANGGEDGDANGGEDHGTRKFLLSVYDYRTDVSAGVSEWVRAPDAGRIALEPSAEPLPSGDLPGEAVLRALVQLVLATVEHAVEATYEGLHV